MNKSNDKPLVSVIIPAYNNADELKKTLETTLCQTYNNFEIIVIDDGSEEDLFSVTTDINDCRISYYKTPMPMQMLQGTLE